MTCEKNRIGEDELQLIDFSEEDDYLIAIPFRDSLEDLRLSVTFDSLNECDRIKLFKAANSQVKSESMEPRRPSFLRKSLAWDNAFFTSAGVLNLEELFMINKGFQKAESNHTSSECKKTNTCCQNKVKPFRAPKSHSQSHILRGSTVLDSGKTKNKSRKAGLGPDLTVSKRSRWGDLSGLPKSTSFTSPITQKDSKVHCSYESSSSSKHLSNSIRRKMNPKNTKRTASPSSARFPLSPTCSSSTSPSSSIDGWFSESSSSCLRMPSPKIGFFDEVSFGKRSPLPNANKLNKNKFRLSNLSPVTPENVSKFKKGFNGEQDGRKNSASFSKLKPNGQTPKEDIDMKQKENVCSFEDQVNGLSRCFEVIHLNRDLLPEVKCQLPVHCSRTPLAEKTYGKIL